MHTKQNLTAQELNELLNAIPAIWRRKHTKANELKIKLMLSNFTK